MYEVTRDTVREEVLVAVHDTIREVTTITVQLGQAGDTVRVAQVTDRDCIRSKADIRSKKEVVRVERDTVYVERRDSVVVRDAENISHQTSAISHLLKWILAIAFLLLTSVVLVRARH